MKLNQTVLVMMAAFLLGACVEGRRQNPSEIADVQGSEQNLTSGDVVCDEMDSFPFVNIECFAQTPDGGVASDTQKIQAAIDYLLETTEQAGTVFIPAGDYSIDESIDLKNSYGITIEGAGSNHDGHSTGFTRLIFNPTIQASGLFVGNDFFHSKIRKMILEGGTNAGYAIDLCESSNTRNSIFEDLKIVNFGNSSGGAFCLEKSYGAIIRNNFVKNCFSGVVFRSFAINGLIDKNTITRYKRYGVSLELGDTTQSISNTRIVGNIIEESNPSGCSSNLSAVHVDTCINCAVSGNHFERLFGGAGCESSGIIMGGLARGTAIVENTFTTAVDGYGIHLNNSTDTRIEGNRFDTPHSFYDVWDQGRGTTYGFQSFADEQYFHDDAESINGFIYDWNGRSNAKFLGEQIRGVNFISPKTLARETNCGLLSPKSEATLVDCPAGSYLDGFPHSFSSTVNVGTKLTLIFNNSNTTVRQLTIPNYDAFLRLATTSWVPGCLDSLVLMKLNDGTWLEIGRTDVIANDSVCANGSF